MNQKSEVFTAALLCVGQHGSAVFGLFFPVRREAA